jgi:EAL domain-containing protein (putative c-di-GMP-specific phosphodiesterase class I)
VVAEGIERPDQLGQLREMGCDLGQGFGLASPMKPAEAAEFMARQAVREDRSTAEMGYDTAERVSG